MTIDIAELRRIVEGPGMHLGLMQTWFPALLDRVEELERERDEARQRLLTAAGDDLCRLSQEEIKAMSAGAVKIPPKEEFLASCERFHAQVAGDAGVISNCLTLAQLIAENEKQRQELDELREPLLLKQSQALLTATMAERDSAIDALADANEQLAAAREAELNPELAAARADAERWRACKVHGFPRPVYSPEYRINYWRVLNDDTFPVSPEAAIDAAIKALAAGKERGDA